MMKSLIPILLIILLAACTPTSDEAALPTRVILPTDSIAIAENATEAVIDPLEQATEPVIDPLERATEMVVDPLERATQMVIDPLPPAPNNPAPIVIPPLPQVQQTELPTITPSTGGLIVIMPTFDLTNLPTSVPTPTPYPLVENFATLVESPQIVRITGTVEIFIEPVRDDDIFLLRDRNGVAIELIWDYATIDYIPGRGQIVEAIGVIRNSPYGHSALMMETISIVPLTPLDERDV